MHLIQIEHEGKSYNLLADGPLRLIRDTELARILGMKRPREIRRLIKRYLSSLGVISRYRDAKMGADGETATRGRPGEGFDLTEEQALFITAKAETKHATAILKTIIEVFVRAMRGELAPAASLQQDRLEALIARAVGSALTIQAAAMPEIVQRAVSAELEKRTGVLGPAYAKRILATIRQQTDKAARGAKRGTGEWNRLRGRRDSMLRDILCWRGAWSRCPHPIGHVETALQTLGRGLDDPRPVPVQLPLTDRALGHA